MQKIVVTIIAVMSALGLLAQNSVESVLQSIEQNNTTLAALRKGADAAKLGNHTGLTLSDPEVEFGYLWGDPSSIGSRKDLNASQSFDLATIGGAKRRLARQQDELVDWQYKTDRIAIMLEARQQCMDVIYYNAMLSQLQLRLRNAREIEQLQKRRLDVGDANLIDYNGVLLDLAAVEADMNRFNAERNAALCELQRLNGGVPVVLSDSVYPDVNLPADFESWYAEASKTSPALAYVAQEVNVAERQLAVNRADGLPRFSVGFLGEYVSGSNYQGVTVGMSIPLWANKNRVRQAKAEVEAARARQTDAHRQFYLRLQTLYKRQQSLRHAADGFAAVLRTADNTILLKKALDAGNISTMEYIQGTRQYYDAVGQYTEAQRDWQKAWAEIISMLK